MKTDHGILPFGLSLRKLTITAVCVGLPLLLFFSNNTSAQEERKPTNLKVLDSTITHDSLMSVMGKFTNGLGVECGFCHVRKEGAREPDFASDEMKTKLTAREMLKMVSKINGTYLSQLPTVDTPQVIVECVTCHRGQPVPRQLQDVLKQSRKTGGMAALDSVYRSLREDYYGSGSFDFSDHVLAQVAMEISHEGGDDAFSVLKLNQEFNPKSSISDWVKGRIYVQRGDTAAAITAYKRALEIDPNNRRVKRELQTLGVKQ